MCQIKIESLPYNMAPIALRKDIAQLLNTVWPEPCGQGEIPVTHREELFAQSFYCYFGNLLVGYAAVVYKRIFHCGHDFMIAGLSCVATHPDYRGCGIGQKVVSAATQYMERDDRIDFGIFTCHPDLVSFYQKAGDWDICHDVVLIGSHDPEAISSKSLNVAVLLRLFSAKAKCNEALFYSEPISLDFPKGEFL